MAIVCSIYGSEHRQLKRRSLVLAFFDLIFIITTISFAMIQLYSVIIIYKPPGDDNSLQVNKTFNSTEGVEILDTDFENASSSILKHEIPCDPNNSTADACEEEEELISYRDVIGARFSSSIQLIIYFTQLGFGILLIIAAYHNDSRSLHLWVIFSEVIVVLIFIGLVINFFGKFLWTTVILTFLYLVFKVFLIRLVSRFIRQNDLELTHFGSVGDFD